MALTSRCVTALHPHNRLVILNLNRFINVLWNLRKFVVGTTIIELEILSLSFIVLLYCYLFKCCVCIKNFGICIETTNSKEQRLYYFLKTPTTICLLLLMETVGIC